MDEQHVNEIVARAMREVERRDAYLLQTGLCERCVAGRLAMYLQEAFSQHHYDVDIEYNRNMSDSKYLDVECLKKTDEKGERCAWPDVIVHRRGTNESNLLVIEMKMAVNKGGIACDERRVRGFMDPKQYGYRFGVVIVCHPAGLDAKWIRLAP